MIRICFIISFFVKIISEDNFYDRAKLDFEFSHMQQLSLKKPTPVK